MRSIASLAAALAISWSCAITAAYAGTLTLESAAFANHETIPDRYTCLGSNDFPPLDIGGVPNGTKSLAFVVEDPDSPGRVFVHWVVWNVDPQTQTITVPRGLGTQGQNSYGTMNWQGPCPPAGQIHRYVFKVYALNSKLNLPAGSIRQQLDEAMQGHILDSAEMTGMFGR